MSGNLLSLVCCCVKELQDQDPEEVVVQEEEEGEVHLLDLASLDGVQEVEGELAHVALVVEHQEVVLEEVWEEVREARV